MERRGSWSLLVLLTTAAMCVVLMAYLAVDAPSQAELAVITHAREHKILTSEYPDCLIGLLERNPETEEFVLNYPFRQEQDTDLSNYDRSQGVPLLMQWDTRWGYMEYGGTMVGVCGGGPMCLSMAGYYLTGELKFYPQSVVRFAMERGYLATGRVAGWDLITKGGPEMGLDVKEVAPSEEKLAQYLNAGYAVIAAMEPGDFGECVVLTGLEDGKVTVNDPDSYVNSGKTWDYDAFISQASHLWVVKAA